VSATILAVDDDEDVRRVEVAILSDAGYRLLEAPSGEAALSLLRGGEAVDLVLSDMVMPGLNGFDLMRLVLPFRPGTRFLFTSGYWPHIVRDVDDRLVLIKPFSPHELVDRVRRILAAADSA
jgi:CheY-like chemotaxis protein